MYKLTCITSAGAMAQPPTEAEQEAQLAAADPTTLPFCGKIVVLSGDFQQTAPVVMRADRGSCASAWASCADWWRYDANAAVNHKTLSQPMRAADDPEFDEFVQSLGAGAAPLDPDLDASMGGENAAFARLGRARRGIRLPCSMFAQLHTEQDAIHTAHPDLRDARACGRSGVLCTTNAKVDDLNAYALSHKAEVDPDNPIVKLSGITTVKDTRGADMGEDGQLDSSFLRACEGKNVPPHDLRLSVGCVCMLMRNMAPGWTNGKRVVVLSITNYSVRVVDAEHWQGVDAVHNADHVFCVPRILFDWKFSRSGMMLQRRQFPLRLAYAVTFNKSQGKTLQRAVVDLRSSAFAHGQLYVALSRVRSRHDISILCNEDRIVTRAEDGERFITTLNVVERVQLVQSMPEALRAAFELQYPVP